jgi:hypothetical protein
MKRSFSPLLVWLALQRDYSTYLRHTYQLQSVFSFSIFARYVRPQEDVAKFGYRSERKVNEFRKARIYCLNMAIFKFVSSR